MSYRSFIARTLVVLGCCVSSLTLAAKAVVIDKGQIDERQYHYLELENKLKVILISDPEADKAAAALDVHVGSSDDPRDREGLAHFLEHMLFLGTKKYPDPADYQAFIDGNAGNHNAYTSAEHTNYFFDIDAAKLESALDRFSQFFIAPLLDARSVERERNIVHSEYQARIKEDSRRGYDVYRQTLNPEHPYSKFSVGSLETLADRENDLVKDDMRAFYRKHYTADKMALVVLGRESIEQLQAMVESRFSQIPVAKTPLKEPSAPLFAESTLPIEVTYQPVQDIREMSLAFPLPSLEDYYGEKPLSMIGSLLGHEGKGSLLSLLKAQGWAEGLSAGGGNSGAGNATFAVNIDLTEEGLKRRELIRSLVFYVLDVIKREGIEEWRFKEEQQLASVGFQFREKGDAIDTVSRLADQLHDFPPSEVISAGYLYKRFDAPLIHSLLDQMTPENVFMSVVYPNAPTDKITYHYQVPYSVKPLTTKLVDIPEALKKQYHLPEKNIFVPKSIELYKQDQRFSLPTKIDVASKNASLWAAQDISFGVPKALVSLRIKSPVASGSLRGSAMNQLMVEMVEDALNENGYPAIIAGLSYAVHANSRGFDIYLEGYDDQMSPLLDMITEAINSPRFNQERFENIKISLMRDLSNSQQLSPYRQLFNRFPVTLYSPYYADKDLAQALEKVSFADLKAFAGQWLKGGELQGLFYGNLDKATIEAWKKPVASLLKASDNTPAPARVVNLPKQYAAATSRADLRFSVDHNDKAVALYVQGVSDTLEDQAKMMLLRQILESSFYSQLRTEQQLGYIVFLTSVAFKEVPGSAFMVQSPSASVETIKQGIETFIKESASSIPDKLGDHQRALETKLLEKPQTLSQKAGTYWSDLIKGDESFSYRKRLVDEIYKVDAKALRQYYQQVFQQPSSSLWFTAQKDVSPITPDFSVKEGVYQYP